MWGVLIAGGALTVLFTYLFEVEDAKAQVFMTALVTLALSLNLLLVALFNNPYKGYMRITSRPFFYDLKVMQELEMEYHD
jgi:high-affinity Fe2+/Pb2+ permease